MFQLMCESNFMEGGALNSFGDSIDAEGKEFKANMKYTYLEQLTKLFY